MPNIKNGRRPSSQKFKPIHINPEEIFMNPLGLDPKLVECLKKNNLAHRFINYKKYVEMGGQHDAYWVPIRRGDLKKLGYDNISTDTHAFVNGSEPDGFIRRGDLILATRSKDINDKHKAYLRQEASRGQYINKTQADELRDFVQTSGLDMKVHEGYQDDYQKETDDEDEAS